MSAARCIQRDQIVSAHQPRGFLKFFNGVVAQNLAGKRILNGHGRSPLRDVDCGRGCPTLSRSLRNSGDLTLEASLWWTGVQCEMSQAGVIHNAAEPCRT